MKPDTASRLLYQEAALRSFLRSDSIAQSFIQNTPNYNIDDLQQLYFASASIKSKKMMIEFVKITTKQFCLSLRDRLPLFRYLNPDNISTDLTDDELMLLIHEASHSMNLEQQLGSHGNIAFLVAKNIIFNLVGVNATATLGAFLKTPDLGSFASMNKGFDSDSPAFESRNAFPPSSSAFPMPPPPTPPSALSSWQTTATSSALIQASTPSSSYMPPYGSSPTIISTSVANLSFVSMNSSMPQHSNPFMTTSTSTPHTTTHSVTQSNFIPAITSGNDHNTLESNVGPDFDARSNASESSETKFEVIGEGGDNDDDNSRSIYDETPVVSYSNNRVDANYGAYDGDGDSMSVESDHGDDKSEKLDNTSEKLDDDEPERLDDGENDDDKSEKSDNDDHHHGNNDYQAMGNYDSVYDDLFDQEDKAFEQEILEENEMQQAFSLPKVDDRFRNLPTFEEVNNRRHNRSPSTPPPLPAPFMNESESPRNFPLRKKSRKRKASTSVNDNENMMNKKVDTGDKSWLEPDIDFQEDYKASMDSVDHLDSGKISNIHEILGQVQRPEKKLFNNEGVFNLMNDLKRKGVMDIPSSPRDITFSNIDT